MGVDAIQRDMMAAHNKFKKAPMMKKKLYVLLIIDSREKALLKKWKTLKEMPYHVATASLDVGDVWICSSPDPIYVPSKNLLYGQPELCKMEQAFPPPQPRIVVERKTVSDLNASFGDGRYADQKMRLINCDAQDVVLLVEGFSGSQKYLKPPQKKRLLSTFTNSMFRDNLRLYHTANVLETFEWLHHTCVQLEKGLLECSEAQRKRARYTDVIKMSKKANLNPQNSLEVQLASVPGVSTKMGRRIAESYPSMMNLCQALEQSDNPTEVLKEEVGPVRSKRIYEFLKG